MYFHQSQFAAADRLREGISTMNVLVEDVMVPETGVLTLQLPPVEIDVSAEQARRTVNIWLLNEVSYMMRAEAPTLVVNGQTRWRVPAVFTAPHVGAVGQVGAIDVDAISGAVLDPELRKAEIILTATKLAKTLPPYPGPREAPVEYLAKDVPRSPLLILPEEE